VFQEPESKIAAMILVFAFADPQRLPLDGPIIVTPAADQMS